MEINAVLTGLTEFDWPGVFLAGGILLGAVLTGVVLHGVLFAVLRRKAAAKAATVLALIPKHLCAPSRLLFPLLTLMVAAPSVHLPEDFLSTFRHVLSLLFILAVAWSMIRLTAVFQDVLLRRFQMDVRDNLKARKIHTQLGILRRVLIFLIAVIAVSSMLMTLDNVRQIGVSLLASAGVIGIIAGFAAQRSIATLIAGIQVALTQPIRLDDVVIVEGEWGRIEEITLTYVVVRIWDLRRLIVPINYFMETPFQNWTRVSADILGTVFLYADYTIPVDDVRARLHRILDNNPLWDRKVWGLQVTNATDRTVELRALMSAADAGAAWDLRCQVREELLAYIRQHHPQSLPRLRADARTITGDPAQNDETVSY